MTHKRDKWRQQWEQELHARQQNVTPADYPEGLRHVRIEGFPRITPQWRFWLGIVVMSFGLASFRSDFSTVASVSVIAVGLLLSISALRWSNKR